MKVMHILSKKSLLGTESKQNRVVRIEEENLTNLPISEAEEMEINAKIEILISVQYSCAQCKYVTDAKNQLGNHIGAFHKDSCDQCDYITPTKQELKIQVESKHEAKLVKRLNCNFKTPAHLDLQVSTAMSEPHSAALITCAILEYSDCNVDPEQWGVALTYHGQFDPGGSSDYLDITGTRGREQDILRSITRSWGGSGVYLNLAASRP